ncbi:MAG TPA: hypothetical protein VGH08_04845 [Chthoniobacterales bacterium]|jgi:hypothetical protein
MNFCSQPFSASGAAPFANNDHTRIKREFACRAVNLALLSAKIGQLTSRKLAVGSLQAAFDLLAVNLNATIIDLV